MALRNYREISSHRDLDVVPFFRQLARGNRFGFQTEQLSGLFIGASRRFGRRRRRIRFSSINETASNTLAVKEIIGGA